VAYRYKCVSAEALAGDGAAFDVVVASEVIEHVKAPEAFCMTLARLSKVSGCVAVTTINRTALSYILTIAVAEQLLRLVPPGTHSWQRYVTPAELQMAMGEAGMEMAVLAGMQVNPVTRIWSCTDDTSANYAALFQKA
jgi:2-polyprenyl-6-hydroxyphenyl methylase / 3-demethylubiquinone-9 3-methyltransferase